jgi:hypothetical protein
MQQGAGREGDEGAAAQDELLFFDDKAGDGSMFGRSAQPGQREREVEGQAVAGDLVCSQCGTLCLRIRSGSFVLAAAAGIGLCALTVMVTRMKRMKLEGWSGGCLWTWVASELQASAAFGGCFDVAESCCLLCLCGGMWHVEA